MRRLLPPKAMAGTPTMARSVSRCATPHPVEATARAARRVAQAAGSNAKVAGSTYTVNVYFHVIMQGEKTAEVRLVQTLINVVLTTLMQTPLMYTASCTASIIPARCRNLIVCALYHNRCCV